MDRDRLSPPWLLPPAPTALDLQRLRAARPRPPAPSRRRAARPRPPAQPAPDLLRHRVLPTPDLYCHRCSPTPGHLHRRASPIPRPPASPPSHWSSPAPPPQSPITAVPYLQIGLASAADPPTSGRPHLPSRRPGTRSTQRRPAPLAGGRAPLPRCRPRRAPLSFCPATVMAPCTARPSNLRSWADGHRRSVHVRCSIKCV